MLDRPDPPRAVYSHALDVSVSNRKVPGFAAVSINFDYLAVVIGGILRVDGGRIHAIPMVITASKDDFVRRHKSDSSTCHVAFNRSRLFFQRQAWLGSEQDPPVGRRHIGRQDICRINWYFYG
jgi:hypothetical protein